MTALFTVGTYAFTWHSLGSLFTALFVLGLGIDTAVRERDRGGLSVLMLTASTAIWLGGNAAIFAAADAESALNWWKFSFIGIAAIPPTLYGFTLWLVRRAETRPVMLGVLWTLALGLQAVAAGTGWPSTGMTEHSWGYFASYGPSGALFLLYVVLGLGVSVWELLTSPAQGDEQEAKVRKNFLIGAFWAGLVAVLLNFPPVFGATTPPLGYVAVAAMTLLVWVTFRRHPFADLTPAGTADRILEALDDGVAIVDAVGRIRVANKRFNELGPWPDDATGHQLVEMVGTDEERTALGSMLVGEGSGERRLQLVGRGEAVPVLVAVYPHEDPPGTRVGSVVILRDLADQQFFEERLKRSERLQAMGRLAGGVAHDFNNILMAVQGYASILQDELGSQPMSQEVRSSLSEIVSGTERATRLTKQLLTFGSTDVVQGMLNDVRDVLRDTGPIIERLVPGNIEVRVLIPPVAAKAEVDSARLEQVLMNLALNARDAMPEGGVLRIEATIVAAGSAPDDLNLEDGWYVCIKVADTGAGMPPEVAARAFEPFFTTRPDGSGMGLATAYGIVTQAGGMIDVDSRVGEGTTVSVYLPWRSEEADEPTVTSMKRGANARSSVPVVLIAEDNEAVRALTTTVLERAGYDVITAVDGLEAQELAEARDYKIDLLVTDLIMPRVGGRELHSRMVESCPALPTLFMSGHPGEPLDLSRLSGGRAVFLQKPFPPKALLEAVESLLVQDADGDPS